jgi:indolepyruvate ferredoxin oxidoreductase, alpha subunit
MPAPMSGCRACKPTLSPAFFNVYNGPTSPELTIVTSGVSHYYAREAVQRLAVGERVGILRVGTPWPLPERLVLDVLKHSRRILFLEEIEPFLEEQVKILAAGHWDRLARSDVFGEAIRRRALGQKSRGMGEMDPDIATGLWPRRWDRFFLLPFS